MGTCEGQGISLNAIEPQNLAAEFVGTFALVFLGAGSIIVSGGDIVAVALAHGLAIAVLVSALGHISGGLFNPALTLGLWVTRRLDHWNTAAYIVAQLAGAVAGALMLKALVLDEGLRAANGHGIPVLSSATTTAQGIGIEALLTVFLMLAVFGTAIDRRGPSLGGLMIGLVIVMDIMAGGPLTGAAMNPARAFGPELANMVWDDALVYWIGPIIGAVLAALLYHYLFMDENQRLEGTVDAVAPAAPSARSGV